LSAPRVFCSGTSVFHHQFFLYCICILLPPRLIYVLSIGQPPLCLVFSFPPHLLPSSSFFVFYFFFFARCPPNRLLFRQTLPLYDVFFLQRPSLHFLHDDFARCNCNQTRFPITNPSVASHEFIRFLFLRVPDHRPRMQGVLRDLSCLLSLTPLTAIWEERSISSEIGSFGGDRHPFPLPRTLPPSPSGRRDSGILLVSTPPAVLLSRFRTGFSPEPFSSAKQA